MVSNLKVLIGDSDELLRTCIRSSLEELLPGVNVDEIESAEEMIERMSKERYSLTIVDGTISAPYDALEAIRELRVRGYDLPICVFSGDHDENEAIEYGANDFVFKGSKGVSELREVVIEHLM